MQVFFLAFWKYLFCGDYFRLKTSNLKSKSEITKETRVIQYLHGSRHSSRPRSWAIIPTAWKRRYLTILSTNLRHTKKYSNFHANTIWETWFKNGRIGNSAKISKNVGSANSPEVTIPDFDKGKFWLANFLMTGRWIIIRFRISDSSGILARF